jgi:hypothetical protein
MMNVLVSNISGIKMGSILWSFFLMKKMSEKYILISEVVKGD